MHTCTKTEPISEFLLNLFQSSTCTSNPAFLSPGTTCPSSVLSHDHGIPVKIPYIYIYIYICMYMYTHTYTYGHICV